MCVYVYVTGSNEAATHAPDERLRFFLGCLPKCRLTRAAGECRGGRKYICNELELCPTDPKKERW